MEWNKERDNLFIQILNGMLVSGKMVNNMDLESLGEFKYGAPVDIQVPWDKIKEKW